MTRRQTATVIFIVLCVVLVAAAVSLNVGWVLRGQPLLPLVLGVLAFALIIAGIIIYTVFLVRELRRTEQQDSFLNAVTHELKTPIASIRLYLETLQARDISEAKRQEFYRVMLDDTTRLQYTVEQVLRAGVAGQRRKLMHRAPVDVGALAVECIETVRRRHHLPDDAVALGSAMPVEAMIVEGDPDELRIAIGNLLDNAVKYSATGVKVSVELASPSPDTVWVRVKDRGVGIPRRQLRRIFNRFYRFQARGFSVKGTGLGLYMVRSIARQHGGRVFAESEGEGRGATFTLELPKLAPG
jgi:two-component system sensor histidine kinase SenX3